MGWEGVEEEGKAEVTRSLLALPKIHQHCSATIKLAESTVLGEIAT